jgi:hypothetical protein
MTVYRGQRTPERKMGKAMWGARQLFRRPAPVAGTSGFPWIRIGQASTDVPDSQWFPVPFRYLVYDPGLVTQGEEFDWASTDSGDAGTKRWQLTSKKEAFYLFDLQVSWSITGTGASTTPSGVGLRMTSDVNELSRLYEQADWFDSANNDIEIEYGSGVMRLSGVIFAGSGRVWKPQVIQTTGDTRTIGGDYFYLVRLMLSEDGDWISALDSHSF